MMRLLSLFFAVLLIVPVSAQKKEISQARSDIKNRTNLDKAEASMRSLLNDSANRRNVKIYVTLAEAVRAQYEVANEKMYLKEKYDTVAFFNTVRRMFQAYGSLDSVEMLPDRKGRVKVRLRKKNAVYLNRYRRNLYNGGIFFVAKKNYADAFSLFDTYIDCRRQPLFSASPDVESDSLYNSAAFWTVFSGYMLNRPDSTLMYSGLALSDKRYRQRTLIFVADAYLQKRDTVKYVETLRSGFFENKNSKFFFTRLMDYYNSTNRLDSAMSIVNAALSSDGGNPLFLFAKSNLLLNMGEYADCIAISDTLIARNDTVPEVYLNAGVSYMNLALALEKDLKAGKYENKNIIGYYKKALPYMEKYRALAPEDKERWAQSLYNIYLKLNMGRQFEEVTAILKKMRK